VNEFTEVAADLLLVGGGHAHVQVLESLCEHPLPEVTVCVISDHPHALYSGMVPGLVAGDYEVGQLSIDVAALAARARARVILEPAVHVDPARKLVRLRSGRVCRYRVASLDVGSTIRAAGIPGVAEFALPTRPIGRFVERVERELAAATETRRRLRVVVVGLGIAGIELAFTLDARLRALGALAQIQLVGRSEELVGRSEGNARRSPGYLTRLHDLARTRGIEWIDDFELSAVETGAVRSGSRRLEADLVVLATGAAPHAWLRDSPLPTCARGFVRVSETLQVVGVPSLFAVGDCAAMEAAPWVPKAGVYAVRMGPVVTRNLRALLAGTPLERYTPQRDFLAILNLGERRALATKWGVSVSGRLVWRLKDAIDRRFMRRFQSEGLPSVVAAGRSRSSPEES